MKDNTIVDKLARTIEALGVPFVYEDANIQNIVFDTITTPFAAAVPLSSGAVVDERNEYHEQATIAVLFGDLMAQGAPDYDARENERIIDECKQRAYKWLASLVPASEIELVSVNGAERAYMDADAVVTGYMLNITIKEVQGYGRCQL